MKKLLSRAVGRRGLAVVAVTAMLVPVASTANAYYEYECEEVYDAYLDYWYDDCEYVEYPSPEFEDLVTKVTVSSATLTKSPEAKVTVRIYFQDPGIGYTFDDPYVYLQSVDNSLATGQIDLFEVRKGVLEGIGYATSDTQTGKWRLDFASIWLDYDNGDYSYYDAENLATFYVKRNTTLSLNASPEPIKKGKSITVSGTLLKLNPGKSYIHTDSKYSAYSGKTVKIYFDPKGKSPKKYMGSAKTNSKGKYSKKFTAKMDGTWSAEFAGTSNYVAKKSSGDFVDVK